MSSGTSLRTAASTHGINYQTLHNIFNGKHIKSNGRPTKLEPKIEELLVQLFLTLSGIGFCLSRKETLIMVNNNLHDSNKTLLFPEGGPINEMV